MKKLITLLIPVLLLAAGTTYGQVSGYTWSQSIGTYTSLSGATILWSGSGNDDNLSAALPLGFTFNANGTNFTTVYVNTNGTMYIGGSGAGGNYTPISSTTTANMIVAILGVDGYAYDATSQVRYLASGTSPNRTFTVEWYNWSRYSQSSSRLTYMITLEESSNKIYFKYGSFTNLTSTTCQVGLRGSSNSDYKNRQTTTSWLATTAGSSNSSTCTLNSTGGIVPSSGLTWTFTPPVFPPSSFLAVGTSTSQIDLSWGIVGGNNVMVLANTANTFTTPTDGTSYAVGDVIGSATVLYSGNATSFSHTSLPINTRYYYRAYSYTGALAYSTQFGASTAKTWCTTATTPYTEGFESITTNGQLPDCWDASALGTTCLTYTSPQTTYNRSARTGTDFASFYYSPTGEKYFYSPPIHLEAGMNYKAALWYVSGGTSGWTMNIKYGSNASPAGQTNTVATVTNPTNATYAELKGYFSPAATGDYIFSVRATNTATCYYLSWDDFSVAEAVLPPTVLTPVATSASQIDVTMGLNAQNQGVMLVYNTTNTFGTPITGVNYAAGNFISGGGTVLWVGTDVSTPFHHTGLNQNTTYYYRLFSATLDPDYKFSDPISNSATTQYSVFPPTGFNAVPISGSQIDLTWTLDNSKPVMLVYNTTNTFGAPVDGTTYAVGSTFTGGGTVIYAGPLTTKSHTGLSLGQQYFYRIYSVDGTLYSNYAAANATTLCTGTLTLPYTWDFGSSITNGCWQAIQLSGGNWVSSTGGGSGYAIYPFSGTNYAFYNSYSFSAGSQARLITPSIDLSTGTHPRLNFWFVKQSAYNYYSGVQLEVSINGGGWTDFGSFIPTYQAGAASPTWTYMIIDLEPLLGNADVKISFKATGDWWANVGVDLVTIKELEPPSCASAPVPANAATDIPRNIALSWGTASDAEFYQLFVGTDAGNLTSLGNITGTSYVFETLLNANTTYYWKVVPGNQYYDATGCPTWSFTTGASLFYCESRALTPGYYSDITNVTIGSINNTSTCPSTGGYTDFSNLSTSIIRGNSVPMSITTTACTYSGTQGTAVFIDFNQNGTFEVPSERVYTSNTYLSAGTINTTVNIPGTATPGQARMRIVTDYFSTNPSPCGTYSYGETEDYTINILPYDKDLTVVSWNGPVDACNLTASEVVEVSYRNLADETQNNYTLSYFNGTSWVNETVTVPIATGEVKTYTFTTLADFSTSGEYLCKFAVHVNGDLFPNNDTSTIVKVRSYPVIEITDAFVTPVPGAYIQNFDEGEAFWYPGGINNCWELGTPAKTFIDGPSSEPNAWVTKLTGNHPDNTFSWVESPCFDMSTLLNPIFEFKIKYQAEVDWDGAFVAVNVDDNGWVILGDLYQLTNWYNNTSADGFPVWSGQSAGNDYILAKHQIEGAGGASNVKLRVVFSGDQYVNFEGFAFDDVSIYESPILYASIPGPLDIEGTSGTILDLKIKGGVPPYHVLWSPAAGLSCNPLECGSSCVPENCMKPIATPSETTIYTAKVWDSKVGKAADTVFATVQVNVYPQLIVDAKWDATVCDTAFTQIYAMATGGVAPYTYQWDNVTTLTSGTIFNPIATPTSTTTYSVTVTDDLGFTATDQVTITTVSGYPVVDIHPNEATVCLGDALQLTATGGTDYLWSVYPPSQAGTISDIHVANPWVSPTISGVKYTCVISSPCGTASDFVIITVIPKPVVTWNSFSPNHFCVYQNEQIPLTGGAPAGGTYSGPGVHNNMFNPAIAGEGAHTLTYTYINYAVNECPNTATFTITVYPAPNVGLNLTDAEHCVNESPFTLTGGNPVGGIYSGIGVEANMFDPNLEGVTGPGVYAIFYTYTNPATGCTAVSFADSLYVYPNPVVTFDWDTTVCISAGVFELHGGSPEGGVYVGAGVVSTPNFNPLVAGPGEHTIYYNYTDDNGCSGTASSVITVNDLPSITSTSPDEYTICQGETVSKVITLTGTPPWIYTMTIDGVVQSPKTTSVSPIGIDCAPGTATTVTEYAIIDVTDANGCSSTPTVAWTVYSNENPLKFHVIMNDPDGRYCFGTNGIAVGLHASEPGYTYKLYKDGVFTGNTFIGPITGSAFWFVPNVYEPGEYTVEGVSNVSPTNCSAFMLGSAIIGVDTLDVNIFPEFEEICLGGTSILDAYIVNPQISTGPYTFDWAPLSSLSPNGFASVLAHPTSTTTYLVSVTDADGCSATAAQTVTVNMPPTAIINDGEANIICDGSGVALNVAVEFGDSDEIVDYLWDPTTDLNLTDPSAPIASPHVATSYTVVVVDGNGCEATATADVLVTPSPVVNFSAVSPAHICPGGSMTMPLVPLTPVPPHTYSYEWSPADGLSATDVPNPICTATQTTTYSIAVTDNYSGCTTTRTFTVIVNTGMAVELGNNFDICLGTAANLFAHVTNGYAPLSFAWASDPSVVIPPVQNPAYIPAALGTSFVTVTVTDYYGCTATDVVAITAGIYPVAHAGPNDTICEGECTTLMGSGGTSYQWFTGGLPISPVSAYPYLTVCPAVTTTYELRVTSPCGAALSYVSVIVNPATPLNITMPQNIFCQNDASVTVTGYPTNSNGVFSGTGITDLGDGTATFAPSTVGTYDITYTYTNQFDCEYSTTYSVTVKALPAVAFSDIADVCINSTAFALTTGIPAGGTYSGTGVMGGIFNPAVAGLGTHTLTYTITGVNGCTNSATIDVTVNELPEVFNASVSDGGIYCNYPDAAGVSITLDGSAPYGSHIVYSLVLNGFTTGITMPCTGYPIVFTHITAVGTYQVLATNTETGCSELMNGTLVVDRSELPLVYNVTGGGSYCQGGDGVAISLDNSNYGITYKLYRNNAYTGISHPGINGPIEFAPYVTAVGTYTVVAVNENGCEQTMAGSVNVSTYPLPFPYFVYVGNSGQPSITVCAGTTITIRQNANECGVVYELYHNGIPTGLTRTCANGASFTWVSSSFAPGVYTVVGTRVSTGCQKQMNGSATINYYEPVSIISQPVDAYIDDMGDASFTVVAGGYNPGYQWEVSQNGLGPWTPLVNDAHYTGVNASTLYVNDAPYDNWTRNKYRVRVSGPCNTVNTVPATLYIDPVVNVIVTSVTDCAHDTIFVPLTFTHADSINAISLTITYDNTNFTFVNPVANVYPGYADLNPVLNSSNLSILGIGNTIRISYFDLSSSINNGYTDPFEFLKLGFKAVNAGGTVHPLHFVTNIPGACELSKISGEILTTNFVDGEVTVVPLPVIVSAGAVDNDLCQHETIHLFAEGTHPLGVTYTWAYPPTFTPIEDADGELDIVDADPSNSGTYYLTVTSSEWGCARTTSFDVTVNPEPQLYTVILPNGNAACAGSGVEVALSGSEVGVTYQLFLEPNNVTPVEVVVGTGNAITFGPQPVTGNYVVKATTIHGCQRWMTGSVHIQINPLPLWFNVLGGGHYCAGGNGREIRLSGSQLGVQYTLLLNACCCQADEIIGTITGTGSPISFGMQLTPGYYSVVAVNTNTGCQNNMIGCVPIVIDPLPTAALVGGASVCYGTEATLTLNLTGKAPWNVVISDGTTTFPVTATANPWSFNVNPAVTTTYTVVSVTDGNNCSNTGSGSATITVWSLPEVSAANSGPVCVGSQLQLTSTVNGFGPFTYAWSGPNGFTSADANPVIPAVTTDNGGVYNVVVTDAHGCVNIAHTTVVINTLPVVSIEANSPCIGGELHLYAMVDGTGPYSYSWTGPDGFTATGGADVMINNVTAANAGEYTVTVTDYNGCVNTGSVTVIIHPLPVVTCNGITICEGQTINLTADATGNGPFTYYWTHEGETGWYSNDQNPVRTNATLAMAGTYTVTVYDANQCVSSCQTTVVVNPLPEICPVLITEPNVYCFGCIPPQISLGCSQQGVTYTLYHNGVATSYVLTGTGQPINFGNISIPGYYTIHAVNDITGCESWMYGTVEVIEQAPPTATISGDVICIGETPEMNLVLTGDTYWNVVITDGVNKDTIHVASSPFTYIPGTGPHILAPTVTTTYTILLVSDRVCYNVGNSATVVVNPLPNKYNMTGGGYYCNGIGVNVGLNGSQVGINYTLHQNGYTLGTVAGTGAPISFGPQGDGVYWAVAYNPITGCSNIMNGQVIVYPNPDLTGYEVSGGGSYCFGGGGVNIYLSGSQLGKEYKLLRDGIYTGVTLIGTGYALTFTGVMTPGVYTVLLFDPATTCTRTMNGSATVVQRPLPTATISGNATICYGDVTSLHVELTGTAPWTFIINDGINSVVHHSMVSSFDTLVNPTSTRDYNVSSVVDLYCQNGGTGAAHVIVNSPVPYVVTGGGSFCAGGQGVVVGLSGSQTGVNYTLLINGVATLPVVAGTGSPLTFGYQTVAGNYTVVATSTVDGCSRTMNGVAVIQIVPLPTIFNVTGGGACCVGCTHVFVCLDGSQEGIRYELYINGQYSGIYKNGTGMDFCFDYATVAGTYTIKAVNIASGCWAWMNGSAIVVLYPTAQANISGSGTICLGQTANLTVTFTEGTAPFSFGLSDGVTTTTYNGITDNPYTITLTPGAGTHNFTLAWVSDIYGCYNNITTGVATVIVTPLPNVEFNGVLGPFCVSDNSDYTLSGGYPSGGVYSGVGVTNGQFNPAVAGVGSHVITYTYTNGLGCQGFATKTVVVYPIPVVNVTQLGTYCVNGNTVDVYGTPEGGYFIGPNGLVDLGGGHAQFTPSVAGVGGPYTITYVYTSHPEPNNPQFGCVNSAYTTVSVVALPNVSFTGLNNTYCVNDAIVELVGTPAGGTFSGPGIVNDHFFNPALAGVGGPYEINYTVGDSYCTNTATHTVTVLPLPTACTFDGGGICCIGCSVYGFLACSQEGVSYQLVRNGNLLIGQPKLGTGYALNWEIFLGGTYQIVATNLTTGCTNVMNGTITVEIIPQPTAVITGTTTICEGQCAPLSVTLTGTPPFEIWLSDGTDTTIIHNITGYSWTTEVCPTTTTTYSVVSLTDEYCGAFGTGTAVVTVNPIPDVFDVTGGGTICPNSNNGVAVGLNGSQAGVYYELFLDGISLNVVHVGTGSAFDFGTNFTTPGVYTVKSMSLSTCAYNMEGEAVISTYPVVDVTLELFADVCINAAPFALAGGYPDGGVYYVDGFQVNYFDAQAVGVGSHIVTYTYTTQEGCSFSASTFINVNALPTVALDNFAPVCFNAPEFALDGGTPAGGIYYVNDVEAAMFDPSAYGVGSYTITYVYTDGNGCSAQATKTLTVLSVPTVELPQFADVYLGGDPVVLTGGTPTGGVYSGDHVTDGLFYPVELGTFVITYTYADNCGTYTAQSEITVIEGAIYNITGTVTYNNTAATAMNNTTVYLKQGLTTLATATTDANGNYAFNLIAPGTYTVSAASTKVWGGVNSADALLIMKHYVGITPLSGLRLAAADVNGVTGVNSVDALLVAKRFVNQITSFPVGDWVFEVKNVTIVNTDADNNFKALCYGDVNGTYTPPYVKTPATVNLNTAGVKEIKSNELFELPINVTGDLKVGSISLVVNYPENLFDVEGVSVNAPSTNFLYTANNGELRISWYNMKEMSLSAKDVLLTIQFRSRNISSATSGELSLNLDGISELSDGNAATIQNVNLTYPKLVVAVEEYSISNYPNPFKDVTEITYTLPENGKVNLKVYNLLGEVVSVLVNNVEQAANSYKVTFDGSNLVPGIYTYKIEVNGQSKDFVKSGMMVLSK